MQVAREWFACLMRKAVLEARERVDAQGARLVVAIRVMLSE